MTKARDAGEDLIGRLGPHEGFRHFVVDGQISIDGGLEVARAAVDATLELLLREQRKQRSTRLIHDAPFGVKCR